MTKGRRGGSSGCGRGADPAAPVCGPGQRGDFALRPGAVHGWRRGQGHVTVFGAFPGTDVDDHPRAVNVTNPEASPLPQPQAAGVDCRQVNTMMLKAYRTEDLAYLLQAEYDR